MTAKTTHQETGLKFVTETRCFEDTVNMGYDRDKVKDVIFIVDLIDDLQALLNGLEYPDSAHMHSSYEYESKVYNITWDREENPREEATRLRAEEHEKNLTAHRETLRLKAEKIEYERLHAIYGGDDVAIQEEV